MPDTTIPPYQLTTVGSIWNELPESFRQLARDILGRFGSGSEVDEDVLDYYLERDCVYFGQDTHLTATQREQLKAQLGSPPLIVVKGDLDCAGEARRCYVTGDLRCDQFHHSADEKSVVSGRITAHHLATFFGSDDETLHSGFSGSVDTPHAFFWFYDWREIELPLTTSLHIMCNHSYFSPPDQPAWLYWDDDYFALKPEFCPWVGAYWHDSPPWDFSKISAAIGSGQPLWIDGFDPHSLPLLRQAKDYARQKQYEQAFLHAKAALALSPNHYPLWREAGDALYFADAIEQSLPYFLRASELMPAHKNLHNEALDEAAMSAFRLTQYDRAIELATASLARVAHDDDKDYKALPLRIRGQALMKQGDFAAARPDLEKAVDYKWNSAVQRWLAGLACYRLGDHKAAADHHKRASQMSPVFAVEYSDPLDGADFRYPPSVHVDWESRSLADLPMETKDAAYWLRQLQHHNDDFAQRFRRIPADILSRDFIIEAIALDPGHAQWGHGRISIASYIPAPVFDVTIAERLIEASAENLPHIPPAFRSKALLMRATRGQYDIAAIATEIIDRELALKLVEHNVPPNKLPPQWIDRDLCRHALRHNCNALVELPQRYKDDAMYLYTLAHANDAWFIENRIPSRYHTPEMVCHALDYNFELIHTLPGSLVHRQVYEHARTLNTDANLWQQLNSQHGQQFRQHHDEGSGDCARDCWAAFWDEPFIITELARENDGLRPWNLRPEQYTPAVAAAAFKYHPIHFNCIPRHLMTEKMALSFARAYPEDFHDIPLLLRTQAVCEAAANSPARDGGFFRHVPLALRTVPLCIRALELDADNDDYIPSVARYEVFDQLIQKDHDDFSLGHLYNERGCSAALLSRYDEAHADFDFVISGGKPAAQKPGFFGKLFNRKQHDSDDFDADEMAVAQTYKAWAYKLAGQYNEMQALLQTLDDDQRDVASSFTIAEPTEVVDFNLRLYEEKISAASQLIDQGDHQLAYDYAREAEQMLTAAQHPEPSLWAYVLDHLRFTSAELEQDAVNKALCQQILDRFASFQDWPYLEAHNIIRATRRAAYHNLAWRLADNPQATVDELDKAHRYSRASLLFSPIENEDEDSHEFLETAAKVLLRVLAHNPIYQAELDAVLERLQTLGMSADLTEPAVKTALAQRQQ